MPTKNEIDDILGHVYDDQPGMIANATLDPLKRPLVHNADGSISTTRSFSVEMDGKNILLPLIDPKGNVMTYKNAVERYKKTGEHLGIFDSRKAAVDYSNKLHDLQVIDAKQKGWLKAPITDDEFNKVLDEIYGPKQKTVNPPAPPAGTDFRADHLVDWTADQQDQLMNEENFFQETGPMGPGRTPVKPLKKESNGTQAPGVGRIT